MKPQTKTAFIKCSVGLMCTAMIVLCAVYIYTLSTLVYYIAVCAFVSVAVVYAAVDGEAHPHLSRTALVCAVVLTVCIGGYALYCYTGLNTKFESFDALREMILAGGYWGVALFIALTVFQVVVLPIPEAVTILLGVAIYGATVSFILSVIGTLIGSVISFALGKVFGRRLCNWMFGAENTEKYARLLGEKGRLPFIIMLLFPAFPDDMLCMIAGITTMSYGYFILICLVTRPVMIGLTAYLGSGIIPFSGRGIPIWIAIACIMFVALVAISMLKKRMEESAPRPSAPKNSPGEL